jgi:hypothetical protein
LQSAAVTTNASGAATVPPTVSEFSKTAGFEVQMRVVGAIDSAWVPVTPTSC